MPRSSDLPSDIVRSWSANARGWARAARDRAIESRRVATDAAIVDAVAKMSPSAVLDVGCGEGWLCRTLAASGISTVVGFDGSPELIEAARTAQGEYHHLTYAGFSRHPETIGRHRFDVAVCNFSLFDEHLGDLFRSLRAVLKANGVLLIQTIHPWAARGNEDYRDGWRIETFSDSPLELPEPMPWYFEPWNRGAQPFRMLASG